MARARQEIPSLRDRFRPVRRGARLGHAGKKKKKEGAASWGQSVSRIEREGWGARGLVGLIPGPTCLGPERRRRGWHEAGPQLRGARPLRPDAEGERFSFSFVCFFLFPNQFQNSWKLL